MSFGGFLIGLILMVVGFLMVRYTSLFIQYLGDISEFFGTNAPWLSWKLLGIMLLVGGFMVAFNLLQLFIGATLGRLFILGQPSP